MKTNQILESIDRELCGKIVAQRTCDSFLSLGAVLSIINTDRIARDLGAVQFSHFLQIENVSEFVKALEIETGAPVYHKATKSSRGWVHPFLALKMLTHYNPQFEIQVYKWLFDYLIQNRIKSADSYTRLCGVIAKFSPNKSKIQHTIQWVARKIREVVGVSEWNKATQMQLQRRDELQNMFSDLAESLGDCKLAWRVALRTDSQKYGGDYKNIPIL